MLVVGRTAAHAALSAFSRLLLYVAVRVLRTKPAKLSNSYNISNQEFFYAM